MARWLQARQQSFLFRRGNNSQAKAILVISNVRRNAKRLFIRMDKTKKKYPTHALLWKMYAITPLRPANGVGNG